MGFLDFLHRKKEPEQPLPGAEVGMNGLYTWFLDNYSPDLEDSRARAKDLYVSVLKSIDAVLEANSALRKRKMGSGDRLESSARGIRDLFVKKIVNSLSAKEGLELGYSTLSEFNTEKRKTTEEILSMPPKHAILLSRYCERDAENVISAMKTVLERLDKLNTFLAEGGKFMRLKERISSDIGNYNTCREEITALEKKKASLQKELKSLEKKASESRKALDDFLRTPEWKRREELGSELQSIPGRLRETELEITNLVSSARRPLKKLRYHTGGKVLDPFLNDPLKVILSGQDVKALLERSLEQSGHECREFPKLDSFLKALEKDIPRLTDRHSGILEEQKKAEGFLRASDVDAGKEKLEDGLKVREKSLNSVRNDILASDERISKLQENLGTIKTDLERAIFSEMGRKIAID